MPIHDWTRVTAGTWHDFHHSWTTALRASLNDGLLPPDYYAQPEQIAGPFGPDVLALREQGTANGISAARHNPDGPSGGVAVAVAPRGLGSLMKRRRTMTS